MIPDIQFRERGENRADSADSADRSVGPGGPGVGMASGLGTAVCHAPFIMLYLDPLVPPCDAAHELFAHLLRGVRRS